MHPAVSQLSETELAEIVEILARLIATYESGDFDSFLALRKGDLAHGARANGALREPLAEYCRQLGVKEDEIPEDWLGRLGAYWKAYYVEPPVRTFLPERSIVGLHAEGLRGRFMEEFEAGFDALVVLHEGATLRHRLVVPHCRELARVSADVGPLRWLDLELAFEPHDLGLGWLIARFVWDGSEEEWFLHRATTVLDGERRDDRRDLVL